MPTYRLDLAYDGSGFHGYARQADVRTVQGELEDALAQVVGDVETQVAGRTDAGVHARGQVVSLRTGGEVDAARLQRSLASMLGPEIVVWRVRQVEDGFDARFSARSRTYRYRLLNRTLPDPFLRRFTWHVPHPLDLEGMRRAARHFLGEHDFASFCRPGEGRSTVREVLDAEWWWEDQELASFQVRARAFCHQMVRSLVALCVEVGRGRVEADRVAEIIEARDRGAARGAAPPHGLILWEVEY